MAENTNNLENSTPDRKLKFGQAFYNILSLPFKLIGMIWKAYWFVVKVVSVFLMAGIIAIAIRSAYPMNLPEARGMTYYEMLSNRWTSIKNGYEHPHMLNVVVIYALFPPGYLGGGLLIPFCELFPGTKFDNWVRTRMVGEQYYDIFSPQEQVTWENLPQSLWETWERQSWFYFVSSNTKGLEPWPPMTYPDTTEQ